MADLECLVTDDGDEALLAGFTQQVDQHDVLVGDLGDAALACPNRQGNETGLAALQLWPAGMTRSAAPGQHGSCRHNGGVIGPPPTNMMGPMAGATRCLRIRRAETVEAEGWPRLDECDQARKSGMIGYGIGYAGGPIVREPRFMLGPDLVRLIAEIDEFKGRWEALKTLSPDRLGALRRVATIESVGSSTRIEGAKLSDGEVEDVLARAISVRSFETRDEQEVAGYAEAMDLVFEAHGDMRLTENHIRQLHQTLLRHSDKDSRHRGAYKTLPNNVVALDADGREIGVIFETTSPFATPREMEELVGWTRKALDEESLHPLLVIAIFIVVFLAIHPFQDGNGRLSRVLTTLLLLRLGYAYVPYASLERVIEENKDLYYKALRRTQTTLGHAVPDWEPWIGFFLRCLKKQKDGLAVRLEREHALANSEADLPELSLKVVRALKLNERLTIAQLAGMTGANRNTLKVRLRELVRTGRVRRHGRARATWYSL